MKTPQIIDQAFLDRISIQAKASPRKRKNFNFHGSESDLSHRLLNAIEPGTYIPPHRHLDPNKDESMVMVRGAMGAVFFDVEGGITQTVVLSAGGQAISLTVLIIASWRWRQTQCSSKRRPDPISRSGKTSVRHGRHKRAMPGRGNI